MSEETVVAASQAAEVVDPFEGKQVSMVEYEKYRQDGELPARFQAEPADSAPADTLEETEKTEGEIPEPAPESEPEDSQELKPKTAKRIAQLLAKNKELERQIAEKQDVKTESSPAPVQHTRQKPTADDTNPDGTAKYSTYEDFVEELADWKAEQRLETAKREQVQQDSLRELQGKLDESRARYEDADEVIFPTAKAFNDANIPREVKDRFGRSKVFVDLCYVVGSDPEALSSLIALSQSDPDEAVAKIVDYERGIKAELAKPRDEKGKFTAPETKKTNAPKPPSPVGGASSRAFDTSDESLSTEEWALKRNQELARK